MLQFKNMKIISFSKQEIITSELLSSTLELLLYKIKFILPTFKKKITPQTTPGYQQIYHTLSRRNLQTKVNKENKDHATSWDGIHLKFSQVITVDKRF